jgi:hypothetical protein
MTSSAGRMTIVSGVFSAVGVAFLFVMYASFAIGAQSIGLVFGRINDVLIMIAYLLAIPSALALHELLRLRWPTLSRVLLVIGIGALIAIVILQALLVAEVLTFEQEVGPVSVALLVLGGWFIAMGYLGRSSGLLPHGVRMGILAATYVGYPVWAFWLGRKLIGTVPAAQAPRPVSPVKE